MSVDLERLATYRHPEVDESTFREAAAFIIERTRKQGSEPATEVVVKKLLVGRHHGSEEAPSRSSCGEGGPSLMPSQQRALALGKYSLADTIRSIGRSSGFSSRGLGTLDKIRPPGKDRRKR